MARPAGRESTRRRAGRTRARRDRRERDCEPARSGAGRSNHRARIRPAEDRRPFDPGRRCPRGRPRRGHGLSLASPRRGGHGAGRAEADRRSSGARGEQIRHPALAVAGSRRIGRRWPAFLFLVDDESDTGRAARRRGAGHARAADRREAPAPAPSPPAQAPCSRHEGRSAAPSTATACSGHESGNDASSAACSSTSLLRLRRGAGARRHGFAPGDPAAGHNPGAHGRNSGTTAPAAAATPTRFALSNDNGMVRASGVVADDATKTSITDALNAVFGADKVKSDVGLERARARRRGSTSSAPRSTRSKARTSMRSSKATRSTSAAARWTTRRATRSSRL